MKWLNTFVWVLFVFANCQFSAASAVTVLEKNPQYVKTYLTWPEVVEYAEENLPQQGTLMVKYDGYVYLKVDDAYIHNLFPMLGLRKGYREPPYFRSSDSPGAHISVLYPDENVNIAEIGETFHFTLKDIVVVHPTKKTSFVILQVESKELEKLREKYGLNPKLHGHEYHISLARKQYR